MKLQGKAMNNKNELFKIKLTLGNSHKNWWDGDLRLKVNGHEVTDEDNWYIEQDIQDVESYFKDAELTFTEINHFKLDKYLINSCVETIKDILLFSYDNWQESDDYKNFCHYMLEHDDEYFREYFNEYVNELVVLSDDLEPIVKLLDELITPYDGLAKWNYLIDGFIDDEFERYQDMVREA